MDNVNKASS